MEQAWEEGDEPIDEGERLGARSWAASATWGNAPQLPPPQPLADKNKAPLSWG